MTSGQLLLFFCAFALLFLGTYSQDGCGTSGSTLTIDNDDDLDGINNCSTIQGTVLIRGAGYNTTSVNTTDTILTLPASLRTVTGGLICTGGILDYSPTVIDAQGLQQIASDQTDNSFSGAGLIITDYQILTTINFPNLTYIGSNFVIARNPNASAIDGFLALQNVAGNLDITGNFDTLSLSNLGHVGGDFNVQSSSKEFKCPQINRTAIQGSTFVCAGSVADPQPLGVDNSTINGNATVTSSTSSTSSGVTPTGTSSSSASRMNFGLFSRNSFLTTIDSVFYRVLLLSGFLLLLL